MIRFIFAAGLAALAIVFILWWIYITYLGIMAFFVRRKGLERIKKRAKNTEEFDGLDSSEC